MHAVERRTTDRLGEGQHRARLVPVPEMRQALGLARNEAVAVVQSDAEETGVEPLRAANRGKARRVVLAAHHHRLEQHAPPRLTRDDATQIPRREHPLLHRVAAQ